MTRARIAQQPLLPFARARLICRYAQGYVTAAQELGYAACVTLASLAESGGLLGQLQIHTGDGGVATTASGAAAADASGTATPGAGSGSGTGSGSATTTPGIAPECQSAASAAVDKCATSGGAVCCASLSGLSKDCLAEIVATLDDGTSSGTEAAATL